MPGPASNLPDRVRESLLRRVPLSFAVPLILAAVAAGAFAFEASRLPAAPPPEPADGAPRVLRSVQPSKPEKPAPAEAAPPAMPHAVKPVHKTTSGPAVESLLKSTSRLAGGSGGFGDAGAGYKLSPLVGSGSPMAMAGTGFGTETKGIGALRGGGGGIGAFALAGSGLARSDKTRLDSWQGQVPVPTLRAGATDDNADFGEFVKFLTRWSDLPGTAGQADLRDVRDRRFVRVVDSEGRPVPAATLHVSERRAQAVWRGATYGDGRAPFYPRVLSPKGAPDGYTVEASAGGATASADWDGAADLTLVVDGRRAARSPVPLDVLFALDTTASMGDEIDQIKATLLAVTRRVRGLGQEVDLRYGAVLYRDRGDDYVTLPVPFTRDVNAFTATLRQVEASGGGDAPESVNAALREAAAFPWRPGAAKVLFLVGDAPPHMDYPGDVRYGRSMQAALAQGVRVHSVAASGIDALGSLVWRQLAQYTRGKFVFIEYGSAAASAARHGVGGQVQSNNLGDILYDQLRDEVLGWGRDAPPPKIAQVGALGNGHP